MQTASVLTTDLLYVRDTLNSVYHKSVAEDLIDTYRKLNSQNRSSKLTLALKESLDRVEKYIESLGVENVIPE